MSKNKGHTQILKEMFPFIPFNDGKKDAKVETATRKLEEKHHEVASKDGKKAPAKRSTVKKEVEEKPVEEVPVEEVPVEEKPKKKAPAKKSTTKKAPTKKATTKKED